MIEIHRNTSLIDLQGEIWKDITGYEGRYQVSNMGRIKSVSRLEKHSRNPLFTRPIKEKIKLQPLDNHGYPRISFKINSISKTFLVSRIVAKTFIPNPENKREVNHKDFNPRNNCINNLEWATPKENIRHALDGGRFVNRPAAAVKGEDHYKSKLKNKDVFEIRSLYDTGLYFQRELADKYDVTQILISKIVTKQIWRHI